MPVSATTSSKTFFITKKTTVVVDSSGQVAPVGEYLSDNLKSITAFELPVSSGNPGEGAIYLTLTEGSSQLGDEGYELTISETQLKVSANKPAGLFYGVQTIRQLIADKNAESKTDEWEIATGIITDYP